jgi:hypothetical protein
MIGEFSAQLWLFIQVVLALVGFGVGFKTTRIFTKSKAISAVAGLWAGYLFYKFAAILSVLIGASAIILVILAVLTPLGGVIVLFLMSTIGGKR